MQRIRSRIPIPTKAKPGTVLTSVKSKENYSGRLTPELKSQVKQVPDFKKLHQHEQFKLRKAKEERRRPTTEIREFAPASSAKRADAQQPCASDPQFEIDPRSLQAILDSKPIRGKSFHNSTNTPMKTENSRQPRSFHKPPWNDSPTCLVGRYSVYAKSMAEARAMNATPGTAIQQPKRHVDIVDDLCNKLLASTLKKTIGRSRVPPVKSSLQDIKVNLDCQFTECIEEQVPVKCSLPPSLPLWTPGTCFEVTGGREDSLLGEDDEVIRVLKSRPKLYGASRPSCPNPVALELQVSYFIPVCI